TVIVLLKVQYKSTLIKQFQGGSETNIKPSYKNAGIIHRREKKINPQRASPLAQVWGTLTPVPPRFGGLGGRIIDDKSDIVVFSFFNE
uniref:hypothetical protein n=1 Tax=Spirulina sp. CCY15215 TaxID=2767591 RepID=UPI001952891D